MFILATPGVAFGYMFFGASTTLFKNIPMRSASTFWLPGQELLLYASHVALMMQIRINT
jgi:hypothetical protein